MARMRSASETWATKNVRHPAFASARIAGSSPMPYASALTTAAHSAGWTLSRREDQFATSAPRSIVRIAPAFVSSMLLTSHALRLHARRQVLLAGEIAETRDFRFEGHVDGACRTMPLFADDHFGAAMRALHFALPVQKFFRAFARFLVGEIIFLAEDKENHVRVLLDRAGFTQIRELRTLVIARLDLARELRQRQDRHIQFFRQRLQAGRDLREFLHAVLAARPRAGEKLDIVDHEYIEATLPLQPSRARGQLRDRQTTRLIDVEGNRLHLPCGFGDAMEIAFVDVAAADFVGGNTGLLGNDARRK